MSKEWHEQMPSQGVLCKHIWDDEIVKAVSYEDENDLSEFEEAGNE